MNKTLIAHYESHTEMVGGQQMPTIHSTVIIIGEWEIHPSVVIHAFTQLSGKGKIGEGTVIGSHCDILGEVIIGKNVRIQSNVFIPGGTVIEDNVFISPAVIFLNDKYPPSHGKHWMNIRVKDSAVIGGGVVILPGVTIHEKAVIGAGAVVTKDIPPGSIAYGNPAQVRGMALTPDQQ